MLATLTNPEVVSHEMMSGDWSVNALLRRIAKSQSPPFHALIDVGALVTGMSNLEVARFLLENGLNGFEGVVFLDRKDRKRVLVRRYVEAIILYTPLHSLYTRITIYTPMYTRHICIYIIIHTPNTPLNTPLNTLYTPYIHQHIHITRGWRVLPIEQSGILPRRRFAFYDQVHTTGMDIPHYISARAALVRNTKNHV